jgi:adenylyl cyclase-associated protein
MAEISSLSALLKRLEAATTKLEDLAMAGTSAANVSASLTGNTAVPASQESSHPHIEGYDELLDGPVKNYYELSKAIGGPVEEQVTSHHEGHAGDIMLPFRHPAK